VTPTIAAIVPMRHTSDRVAGKNYRVLGDRPLFHHIIETLLSCPQISETIIDTDSDLIRDDAARSFPGVRVVERPPHLRHGMVPMNDVLLHDVTRISADYYLQTHSTNPLLRAESVTAAIDSFLRARPAHDSLFSVTRLQTRLWDAATQPVNHDPAILLRTQDLPPIFEENSCLYLFSREGLERHGSRIGASPLMFELSREEAWDIDEEIDFTVVQALHAGRQAR
jgi:CMP-N-acetylneuraminic acid synthetase